MNLLDTLRALIAQLEQENQKTAEFAYPPEERTPEGDEYLRMYEDVAKHVDKPDVYSTRPRAHYLEHGKAEGRIWPKTGQTFPASKPTENTYPRIVTMHGVNIKANAPLHPQWRPSMTAWVFGHDNHPDGSPKTFVGDPSNAPQGYPDRSPTGFPLVYPGVSWNGQAWVGTPTGPARFHCGESTFDTEEQALNEARTLAVRESSPADPGWQQVYQRMQEQERTPKTPVKAPTKAPGALLPPDETPL